MAHDIRHIIANNIRLARQRLGISQAVLSQQCGWSKFPSRISNYERAAREPKGNNLQVIVRALNVSIDWLYEDHGSHLTPQVRDMVASYKAIKYVPLLQWDQITTYLSGVTVRIKDMLPVSNIEGIRAFAVMVEGDSMEAPQGDSFTQGCTLIVDTEATPITRDYVIAYVDNQPTFKQLIIDSGKRFLKPLNPRYPLTEKEFKILGVVRIMQKNFR